MSSVTERAVLWVSAVAVGAVGGTILYAGGAKADVPPGHTVTNKDCWAALEDPGLVKPCRKLGWTITSDLVLNRHKVVKAHTIPPCLFEDASGGPLPCGWNIGRDDKFGRAYWVDRSRGFHYVWGKTPDEIRTGRAQWATKQERHHLLIGKGCWVIHPTLHRWRIGCP